MAVPSDVQIYPSRQDFDRLVAAAVAAKEDEAERRVAAALADLKAEAQRADEAEGRAAAAERAKIELTLALASGESREAEELPYPSSSFSRGITRGGGEAGTMDQELLRRMEEAELAAAVQVRHNMCTRLNNQIPHS